jgi:hypothetical protein
MNNRMRVTGWVGTALALVLITGVAPVAGSESDGNQSGGSEKQKWSDRITFYADFRGRIESFYSADEVDRHRARYRLRFGFKTAISDNVSFNARLATGEFMNSANQTLGSGSDFDPDKIFVDKAEITIRPFGKGSGPRGGDLSFIIGKMSNPFKGSTQGKDLIIWDRDTTPEGIAATWAIEAASRWDLDTDLAYYVIDENEASENVFLFGLQLDNVFTPTDNLGLQVKGSYYRFDDLDAEFFERSRDQGDYGGNTDGLTTDKSLEFFDVRGSIGVSTSARWPLTAWGQYMINASAVEVVDPIDQSVLADKQDTGYSAGLELGNKKKSILLGAGYYWVQADALPSVLSDSDLFDGNTNGKGWAIYGSRQLWKDTDLAVQVYVGDVLDEDVAIVQDRTLAKRTRFQGDVKIKF